MKTKRIISVILAVIMCFGVVFVVNAETEIPEGYTPIYTAEDLDNIRNNLDGKYILMNDIDLSVYENWEPIGTSDTPFTGELDGDGYQLKNLKISDNLTEDKTYYYGLFGYVSEAVIKKAALVNCDVNVKHSGESRGKCCIGAIAGYSNDTKITDCTVFGKVCADGFSEAAVGGLIGRSKMSEAARCSNYADVTVVNYKYAEDIFEGGVIGDLTTYSTIYESSNHGSVSLVGELEKESCYMEIGGICGNCDEMWVSTNSVINCYNDGKISTDFISDGTRIGGICGESYETQCVYNVGEIVVPEGFEGLAGAISGNIFQTAFGIGMPHYMTNAYYINEDMIPSHDWEDIPLSFSEAPFINVKLLTERDFKNQDSFVGFDFEKVWEMEEDGYPVLKNQPKVTVKESIELAVDEKYPINPGKDYIITSDSPICIDYISMTENGEILALEEGRVKLTVIYDYGYMVEYDITITPPICDDPIIPTPDPEPINNVESAEIVYIPLKNRIVFSAGSPNLPDGIVLKLKYKDGTEKTETIVKGEEKGEYYAGEEKVFGSVRAAVEEYGLLTDTLYINDNTVAVKYDYFVPPTLSYIFMQIINFFLRIAF